MATVSNPVHLTRRQLIGRTAGVLATASFASLLEACSSGASPSTGAPAKAPTNAPAPAPTAAIAPTTAPAKASATTPASATQASTVQTGAKPVRGGILRTTIGADPGTVDPDTVSTIFGESIVDHINPGLTIEDEQTAAVKPNLAESWDLPDDKTYVFHLRQGATFHDGKPLTAADVKFSFDRLLDKDNKLGTSQNFKTKLAPVDATEVVDDHTLKVHLKTPLAVFADGLAEVRIVPRDFDPRKPVGAGPFQFVEWVRNQDVKLKRFDGYWDKGLPYLDQLIYLPTPDEDQKITRLLASQLNFSDTIPFPRIEEVKKRPDITIFQKDPAYTPSHYPCLCNLRRPPLGKVEVRQALSWAIDRQAIKDATFGYAEVISSAVPTGNWAFNPQAPSYNKQDINKAKELLAKAGVPNGFKTSLKYVTSRGEFPTIAQLLQSSWAKIGVQVELLPREVGIWVQETSGKQDFDLAMTGYLPIWDPYYLFSDSYLGSARTSTGWVNAEFDQLAVKGGAMVDQAQRKPIYYRMHEIVQTEQPLITVAHRFIIMAAKKEVQGFIPNYRQINHFTTTWIKS